MVSFGLLQSWNFLSCFILSILISTCVACSYPSNLKPASFLRDPRDLRVGLIFTCMQAGFHLIHTLTWCLGRVWPAEWAASCWGLLRVYIGMDAAMGLQRLQVRLETHPRDL